mmetsp:Transcript_5132/g.13148  ORF Transcript_5132/g.13148 Transcript_5132/m.13148 type:complete len:252 (-) Transcript_5132:32-787(-)
MVLCVVDFLQLLHEMLQLVLLQRLHLAHLQSTEGLEEGCLRRGPEHLPCRRHVGSSLALIVSLHSLGVRGFGRWRWLRAPFPAVRVVLARGFFCPLAHVAGRVVESVESDIGQASHCRLVEQGREGLVQEPPHEQVEGGHWLVLWHHVSRVVDGHKAHVPLEVLDVATELGVEGPVVEEGPPPRGLVHEERDGRLRGLEEPRSPVAPLDRVKAHGGHRRLRPSHLHAGVGVAVEDHNVSQISSQLLVNFDH